MRHDGELQAAPASSPWPPEPVGLIGAGRMGAEIGARLLASGEELVVYDRSAPGVERLIALGAVPAGSARKVAERVGAVISVVSDGPAVLDLLGGADGLIAGARAGLLYIDLSTISVDESAQVARACARADVRYVRSPVLGSVVAARHGRLLALMSGPPQAVEAAAGLLACVVDEHRVLGDAEEARLAKLVANGLMAASLLSLLEGIAVAERAGLDRATLLAAVGGTNMTSPFLEGAAERVLRNDNRPNLTIDLLVKDLGLLVAQAGADGAAAPMATAAWHAFRSAAQGGHGDLDPVAVLSLLERGGDGRDADGREK